MVAKPNKPLTDRQIEKLMKTAEPEWGEIFPKHSLKHLRKIKRELKGPVEAEHERQRIRTEAKALAFVKKNGRMPKHSELTDAKISERQVRRYFENLKGLEAHLRQGAPDAFGDAPTESFSQPRFKRGKIKSKHRSFFLTSAVVGADADLGMLKAIDEYCNRNNAEPIILPCAYSAARVSPNGRGYLDSALKPYGVLRDETSINRNLFLANVELQAAEIDPSTSLMRIGQRDGSFVYANPKQRLRYTSTSNHKWPHAVMTPGACTRPAYSPSEYRSLKRAYIATHDHVMGGIVVDVHDDRIFHFRQMQADDIGGMVDLGKYYSADGMRDIECEAMVPGDIHVLETDPMVVKCLNEIHEILRPKRTFLHDLFGGISCNHWERNQEITRAQDAMADKLSIQAEIAAVAQFLDEHRHWNNVIVPSNHHAFLYKYLERCWFKGEPWNLRYALYLAILLCDGYDPLAYEAERLAPGSAEWLPHDRAVDIKIEGIHVSAHGHKGPRGARGNIKNLEMAFGQIMYGHEHIAQILRGAWCVGTSSHRVLRFNAESPSGWTQTLGLIYRGGFRQLINCLDGAWR